MELVAASKMKKAQENALQIVAYSRGLAEIANRIGAGQISTTNLLLKGREKVDKVGLVIFAPSKGFCGSLSTNLFLKSSEFVQYLVNEKKPNRVLTKEDIKIVSVNREAKKIAWRIGCEEIANFSDIPDNPDVSNLIPIYEFISDNYTKDLIDEVYFVYPLFKSTLEQIPQVKKVLPLDQKNLLVYERGGIEREQQADVEGLKGIDYIFEPSKSSILDYIVPHYLKIQILGAYLELIASEYSARMVAMKKATDNAGELINELTLVYNKERQTGITNEIIEISAASM